MCEQLLSNQCKVVALKFHLVIILVAVLSPKVSGHNCAVWAGIPADVCVCVCVRYPVKLEHLWICSRGTILRLPDKS